MRAPMRQPSKSPSSRVSIASRAKIGTPCWPRTTAPSSIGTGCARWRTPRARCAAADGRRVISRSHRGKKLIAACPLYLKSHSMGEFVFDQGWADAAERSGIRYYPKLLVGVPFTPHTADGAFSPRPASTRAPLGRGAGTRAHPALRGQQAFLGARQFLRRRRGRGARANSDSSSASATSTIGTTPASPLSTTTSERLKQQAAHAVRHERAALVDQGVNHQGARGRRNSRHDVRPDVSISISRPSKSSTGAAST